jgi:hypothetical protein
LISVRLSEATVDRVAFTLDRSEGESLDITYASESLALLPHGDAALVAALPLALAAREPLRVELAVSSRLRSAVATIQDVYSVWWRSPESKISVETASTKPMRRGDRHGGVFSYDIASFHLALAPDSPDLLFAVDADLPPGIDGDRAGPTGDVPLVSTNLAEIAGAFGLDWHADYRGAALASVAHVVADLGRVDLPAPFSVHYLFPWGSHAMLDPLWSGDALEVCHRHVDVDWVDRLRLVAGEPGVVEHMRACTVEEAPSACGRCRGCLYLAAALQVIGRGGERPVDLEAVRDLDLAHYTALADTAVLLRHADRSTDLDLVEAVESAVRRLGPDDVRWPDNWFSYLAELGAERVGGS